MLLRENGSSCGLQISFWRSCEVNIFIPRLNHVKHYLTARASCFSCDRMERICFCRQFGIHHPFVRVPLFIYLFIFNSKHLLSPPRLFPTGRQGLPFKYFFGSKIERKRNISKMLDTKSLKSDNIMQFSCVFIPRIEFLEFVSAVPVLMLYFLGINQ